MLAIAIAIKLEDRGPIFFSQTRIGRHGREFQILKFRSMFVGAEGMGPRITVDSDPRITRVGGFLRSSKLDELPQLFNVVKGDMSMVGPRPEVPEYFDLYPSEVADKVLAMRPGITDPVSIELFNEAELLATAEDPEGFYKEVLLPEKLAGYCDYAESRTMIKDMQIIARTAGRLFRRP
jgi:lipopolysaccharide/colanic/teichoic acid biosynthesis glycosyltransferase